MYLSWYQNWSGQGDFTLNQDIDMGPGGGALTSVSAGDLDGDGDLDVLAANAKTHEVAWYENTDGNGTYGPRQVITTDITVLGPSMHAVDLDADHDLDLLLADNHGNRIVWCENVDGAGASDRNSRLHQR